MADDHDTVSVLVVEDEPALVSLYRQFLASAFQVHTAETAEEALETLDADVDVLLLDRHLPDRPGDEVLEDLRNRGYDLPVAMVSAIEPDVDVLELAIDAYVTKPVGRDELTDTVRRMAAFHDLVPERRTLRRMQAKRDALENGNADPHGNEAYDEIVSQIHELEERIPGTQP